MNFSCVHAYVHYLRGIILCQQLVRVCFYSLGQLRRIGGPYKSKVSHVYIS